MSTTASSLRSCWTRSRRSRVPGADPGSDQSSYMQTRDTTSLSAERLSTAVGLRSALRGGAGIPVTGWTTKVGCGEDAGVACFVPQADRPLRAPRRHPRGVLRLSLRTRLPQAPYGRKHQAEYRLGTDKLSGKRAARWRT